MDRNEFIAEIKRLKQLLDEANKRAVAQYALIDKLTAASLRVQALLKKLGARPSSGAPKTRRGRGKAGRGTQASSR